MKNESARKLTFFRLYTLIANLYNAGSDGVAPHINPRIQAEDASKIRCYNDVDIICEENSDIDIKSELKLGRRYGNFPINDTVVSVRKDGFFKVTDANIRTGVYVDVSGEFHIGNSYINPYTRIRASDYIEINDNCSIGWNVDILDSDLHNVWIEENKSKKTGKVVLESDVWIGKGATILKGVTVGQGAAVAADSVVTNDVPSNTLVGGNPAEVIYQDIGHD